MTKKIDEYIKSLAQNTNEFFDFIEILKEIPGVLDVKVQFSDDKKVWVNDFDNEYSYTRIVITKERGFQDDREIWIKVYGIISMLSEDYSSNCEPCFESNSPIEEWTDKTIKVYFSWYNHYGS